MKNKKGFTLVELLAVIVILAILATAAFTLVLPQIEKSRKKSFVSEAASIIDSAELFFLEHPTAKSVSLEELKPYIKNYDSSKTGCICPPTEGTNAHGYMIRFSNGDYKTYLDGFYEIESLKTSSGNATEIVVKIDDNNPNWNYSTTNPACPTTCPTSPSQAKPSDSNGGSNSSQTTPSNSNGGSNSSQSTIPSGRDMNRSVFNAAQKCQNALRSSFRQDCASVASLYEHGFLREDLYRECEKNYRYRIYYDEKGYLHIDGGKISN